MLTKVELSVVESVLKISCRWGMIPLKFSNAKAKGRFLSISNSKGKRAITLIKVVLSFGYLSLTLFSLPLAWKDFKTTTELNALILNAIQIVIRSAQFILYLASFLYMKEIGELLNQALFINANYGPAFLNKKYLEPNWREYGIQILPWYLRFSYTLFVLCFLAMPTERFYIFSLLPTEYQNEHWFLSRIGFLFIELVIIQDGVILGIFYLIILFVYISCSIHWLEFLCRDVSDDRLQFHLYHQLQILNTIQNQSFGRLLLPWTKMILGIMCMGLFCACVQLGDSLNAITYSFGIVSTFFCYMMLIPGTYLVSRMYNLSVHFITKLILQQTYPGGQVSKKVIKSLSPIKCAIGSLYYMEKDAKSTMVRWLFEGTTQLLLAFR